MYGCLSVCDLSHIPVSGRAITIERFISAPGYRSIGIFELPGVRKVVITSGTKIDLYKGWFIYP